MYSSRMAPRKSPSAHDLLTALREATNAVAFAQAADHESIVAALDRLERATAMLSRADLPPEFHAAVRHEIDHAGLATKRLFEAMIVERDRLGGEIGTLGEARRDRDPCFVGIDFTM
jgi:hypothetical protein